MGFTLGQDAKIYFCAAGIGGTPVWTEIGNVKDVTLNLQKAEADVTTRGNNGWKATVGTLKDGSVEFNMIWDTTDAAFNAFQEAYFDNTVIGVAVMDGDIETNGSQGLWADMMVTDFTRSEPLEDAITVKVTVKPTYSANPADWVTIGA
jgi:hypothetical protein